MTICRMLSKLKTAVFSSKALKLSSLLTFDFMSRNLYLRPGTEQQRQHMLGAYLKATKTEYPNGGHIFVGSEHAAEVMHYLDVHQMTYTLHSLVDLNTHLDIMPAADKAEGVVRVFVEDDRCSYAEREERLLTVQRLFQAACVPIHTFKPEEYANMKIYMAKVEETQAEITRLRRFVIFHEMTQTFERRLFLHMSQLRGRISFCIISTEDNFEKRIKALLGRTAFDREDFIYLMANTAKIYGSGPKHQKEIVSQADGGESEEPRARRSAKPINISLFFKEAIGDYGLMLQDGLANEVILNQ
jgi:hypothetical protein